MVYHCLCYEIKEILLEKDICGIDFLLVENAVIGLFKMRRWGKRWRRRKGLLIGREKKDCCNS